MSWRRYLKPRILRLFPDGADVVVNDGRGAPIRIVPRAQLVFERVRAASDLARLKKAARLRLKQTNNMKTPRVHATLDAKGGRDATIWSWDDAAAETLLRHRIYHPPAIPEPLLYPPQEQGARLIACIEGFEGQIWRDGALRSSRWWPFAPDAQEWRMFLRGAQEPMTDSANASSPPAALRLELSAIGRAPLFRAFGDLENLERMFAPARLAAMIAIVVSLVGAAQGARYFGESAITAIQRARYTAFLEANREVIEQRQSALSTLAGLQSIEAAFTRQPIAGTLASFLEEAPADQAAIEIVTFTDRTFEAKIRPARPIDAAAFVARLEAIDGLDRVSVDAGEVNNALFIRGETTEFAPAESRSAASRVRSEGRRP